MSSDEEKKQEIVEIDQCTNSTSCEEKSLGPCFLAKSLILDKANQPTISVFDVGSKAALFKSLD